MLAISVWSPLRDAVASLADYAVHPPLDTPATPERVLLACEALRRRAAVNASGTLERGGARLRGRGTAPT
jgi:xanthine dehydrogenase molybdopterin-binding subunit B